MTDLNKSTPIVPQFRQTETKCLRQLSFNNQPRKKNMLDVILVGAFVAFWLLLQMVILPRFGVRT